MTNAYKLWKHPEYKHVYGELVGTPIGRLAWTQYLVTPRPPKPPKEGEKPRIAKFEVSLLLPKDDPKVIAWEKSIRSMADAMMELFNQDRSAPLGGYRVWYDGDDENFYDHEKYPFNKGMWVITPTNEKQPTFVDKDRAEAGLTGAHFKGGMKAKCAITPMMTAHGLSYKLQVVQLIEDDGIRFGGGQRSATEMLDVLKDDTEEDSRRGAPSAGSSEVPSMKKGGKGKEAAINVL